MKPSRTQLWTVWFAPGEHTRLHWLACAWDRTMSHCVRRLIAGQVAYERGECCQCPTCGAALTAQNGAATVRADHSI